jgi:hypothetical protein
MAGLRPESELVIGVGVAAVVYSIFSNNAPNLADVRADGAGNVNTYKTTNSAALTATGIVGGLAVLAKSPTVLIIGGTMILIETWKLHFANYGSHLGQPINGTASAGS